MQRVEPMSIRQIIDKVIDASGTKEAVLEHRATYMWPDIVGQGINRVTTRRYVSKGVLHVYISSASMKSEIEFSKHRIIDAINTALGEEVLTGLMVH